MGHLKDITNQPKIQTFPSTTFQIEGEVPKAQCTEAKIEGDDAHTDAEPDRRLVDPNKFTGYALGAKICTITASVGGNTGDFTIEWNSDSVLKLATDPGNGDPVTYHVHDGGELELARDVQSFAEFIHAAGYAYTIKGGKLHTNIPSAQLQDACTITFDPLT